MSENTQAEHGDERVEELRQQYGDLANLTVPELQDKAREQGIDSPSDKTKEELLQALNNGNEGGGSGGGGNEGGSGGDGGSGGGDTHGGHDAHAGHQDHKHRD